MATDEYIKELHAEVDKLEAKQADFPTEYKELRIAELTKRLESFGSPRSGEAK